MCVCVICRRLRVCEVGFSCDTGVNCNNVHTSYKSAEMNGASDKCSPCASSDGPDSLDAASPVDLFQQEPSLSVESSCNMIVESSSVDQKAISGLDVALSEDFSDAHKQNAASSEECFDTASESNCVQSELSTGEDQDASLLASDLDALPCNGGFDDMMAMEAERDSQFEQTMAMLRDLSGGSDVSPALASCINDPLRAENATVTDTDLNTNFSRSSTSGSSGGNNEIGEDDGSSLRRRSVLSSSEPKVDAIARSTHHVGSLVDRKQKASSGFFNRCIENLLQRGRETAAATRSVSPVGRRTENEEDKQENSVDDLSAAGGAFASTVSNSVKSSAGTSSRSHRKSRKPTKLTQMRLSEDVVLSCARTPLPVRCENCSYTCNTCSELNMHSSVCSVDVVVAGKYSGFTCTCCKTRFHSLEEFRKHLSHHPGDHAFHSFFCRYCDHYSDSMDDMDGHVSVHHPTEKPRYEVSLEKVSYLQNMLECPVCGGAFLWKSAFVRHCQSDHQLGDLAAYLESTFADCPPPENCKVSRQLFESFADILLSDSVAEDAVGFGLGSEASQYATGTAKRFQCDQCSFSADNWELWDRHVQECHELATDNFLRDEDGWSSIAPLVIDEDESLPTDVSASGILNFQPQKMFPTPNTIKSKPEPEHSLHSIPTSFTDSLKPEGTGGMFPPGMEPEIVPVSTGSGELARSMKIGSGRKGVKLRCRLCPFECYRTPNFRRHLAIHVHQAEYPESYRCAYCKFQHRRLNCIRFHLGKYHGQLPAKLSRVVSGKVVEVINADDVNVHISKYGRTVPTTSTGYVPILPAPGGYPSATLQVNAEDYAANKTDEMGTTQNPCNEVSVDDHLQSGNASMREKRLCKPPKRLSESSDFQSPGLTGWRVRRVPSGGGGGVDVGTTNGFARLSGAAGGRPFDDNIAEDYIQSDLPPGMIYPEPIKCPRCSFTNRVRINLVRHMKQHHTEDQQQQTGRSGSSSAAVSGSEPSWMDNVPAWARPPPASGHTSPGVQSTAVKNSPTKTLKDFGTFGSRTGSIPVPKPAPKLPNRLEALSGADVRFTHGFISSGRLEWNSDNYAQTKSSTSESRVQTAAGDSKLSAGVGGSQLLSGGRAGLMSTRDPSLKRLFKCAYCAVSSRWNRRDISLHVLHVHVRRRAFRCRRCGYGTSKSAAAVSVHCARTHPGRPAIIEDNLTVLNAILPLHTRPGVVLVAFRRPNGVPIMDLDELEEFFGLSKISTDDPQAAKEHNDNEMSAPTTTSFDSSFQPELDLLPQYSGATPLDLSAQMQQEPPALGISQSVFPTPYRDVLSQHSSPVHSQNSFSSQRRYSEGAEKQLDPAMVVSSVIDRNRGDFTATKDSRQEPTVTRRNNITTSASSTVSPAKDASKQLPPTPSGTTAFYRCKLCGYQDSRHDKTKYHVVREHLHLGPYGCAYCPRYMWGRRHVARHIAAVHPSMPVQIRRAFDEFETYLRENIRKIGGQVGRFYAPSRKPSAASHSPLGGGTSTAAVSGLPEQAASVLSSAVETPSLQPAAQTPDPALRRKPVFQCGHCDYRDVLAAKVQGHCLAKHPSKPVRYRRCDELDEESSQTLATGALADVKIESVESLAFGQDIFSSPADALTKSGDGGRVSSSHFPAPDARIHGDTRRSQHQRSDAAEVRSGLMAGGGGGRPENQASELAPYMCRYCQESAWTEELIRSHLAAVHPDMAPQFGVVQDCLPPTTTTASAGGGRGIVLMDEDDDDDEDEEEDTARDAASLAAGNFHFHHYINILPDL